MNEMISISGDTLKKLCLRVENEILTTHLLEDSDLFYDLRDGFFIATLQYYFIKRFCQG